MQKKRLTKKEQEESIKKQLNTHFIFEIVFLVDFILLVLLGISMYILLPILTLVFCIIEFRIERFRKELGYAVRSRLVKTISKIIIFTGFIMLIVSPFLKIFMRLLVLPRIFIVTGTLILLLSKFYNLSHKK